MRKVIAVLGALLALVLIAPAAGAQDATITLIHGIPDTDVDVAAGGDNVFEGFAFGDTQDLSSLAGTTLTGLQVKLAGTDDIVIDAGDVALPASGNTSIIAHLDAAGNPTLGVFTNNTAEVAAGQGRLTVRHTAAAPAVDVRANGQVAFAAVAPGAEGTADLPAGTIEATVVPAGAEEPVVIGPAPLDIAEGESLIVYAVGSLEGETLTVLTQAIGGLGGTPAAIHTGNSPITDEGSSSAALLIGAVALVAVAAGGVTAFRWAWARD
jgi:hypothetical protein